MCGIAGLYIKQPEHPIIPGAETIEYYIDCLLKEIEPRGDDATGVVSVSVGETEAKLNKAAMTASEFIKVRAPLVHDPRMILCHTRLATKGDEKILDNDHPVQYESVFVTHNGHIRNDDELFEKFKDELPRKAQVDTEIISAMMYKYGIDKAHLALQELDGNMAVAVIDPKRNPDTLLLAKGSASPLVILETPFVLSWASTKWALEHAWYDTFGKHPKQKWFSDLGYGKLKIITPDAVEDLEFKPYTKTYTYHGWPKNTGYSGNSRGRQWAGDDWEDDASWGTDVPAWSAQQRRKYDKLCECGETQYWHGGKDYEGPCVKAAIDCDKFRPLDYEEEKTEAELHQERFKRQINVYSGTDNSIVVKVLCVGCETLNNRDECEDVYGYWMCQACYHHEPEQEYDATEELGDDISKMVLEEVAEELGLAVAYTHWLIFDAEEHNFEHEPWVVNSYCNAHDLYQEKLTKALSDFGGDSTCGVLEEDDCV